MTDEMEGDKPKGMNPQEMLEHGRQLCTIGETMISAAQSLGAEDSDGEDLDYEEDGEDLNEGDDEMEEEAPAPSSSKNSAIIMAIKKKLGRK